MQVLAIATWAALAASAAARTCTNMTIEIPVSARTGVFDKITTPVTNADATAFALLAARQGINATETALTGYATTSNSYNISAKYCVPSNANSSSYNLQVLTHGIGFDKTYWDLSFNNYNYSYINTALDSGYHTFTYDRLGIGNSSHGDPRNEIQASLEIAALQQLVTMLRNGTVPGIASKPSKVIGVGHSFGSGQSYALSAMSPDIFDGIVLTGYSTNSSFMGTFTAGVNYQQAYLNQPIRFGNKSAVAAITSFTESLGLIDYLAPIDLTTVTQYSYPPGYLTTGNPSATTTGFLFPDYFDPQIGYFGELTKQPATVGEILTSSSSPMMTTFKGPVLIFTGAYDLPFCGGNCAATGTSSPSIPAEAQKAFPNASAFEAYIQPNTGHGLTFHYNATAGYNYIQSWLSSHSL